MSYSTTMTLATFFISLSLPDLALPYFHRALELTHRTKSKKQECETAVSIGDAYLLLQNYDKAVKYFSQARVRAIRLDEKLIEKRSTLKFVEATLKWTQYLKTHSPTRESKEDEIKKLDECLDFLSISCPDEVAVQAEVYYRLGTAYVEISKEAEAKDVLTRSASLFQKVGDKVKEGIAMAALAGCFERYTTFLFNMKLNFNFATSTYVNVLVEWVTPRLQFLT